MKLKLKMPNLLPVLLIGFGLLLVAYGQSKAINETKINRETGIRNNTYLRTIACISSVTPTERTPAYVKSCYEKAEQYNQVKVTRFGHGE